MKKIIGFMLLFFTAGFICAQDDDAEPVLRMTKQNEVIALNGHATPGEIKESFTREVLLIEPVGWSANGLFAYRQRWHNAAMPGNGYRLVIFDAVNDERIIMRDITTQNNAMEYPSEEEIAITKRGWNALLAQYGISGRIENPAGEIPGTSYETFEGKPFSCWFDYEILTPGTWRERIRWRLIVFKDGKEKVISDGSGVTTSRSGKKIMGYYQSPHENRIIIETLDVQKGFDDENGIVRRLYGCNMEVGFK